MKPFNIFKRTANIPDEGYLSLEELYLKTTTQPAYRAEFEKRLLSDNLFVIIDDKYPPGGKDTAEKDQLANILSYEGEIQVFTSPARIFDRGIIKKRVNCLEKNGKVIFEAKKDATIAVNPHSRSIVKLMPCDIEAMLNGTILSPSIQNVSTSKDPVCGLLFTPVDYPTEIVESLKLMLSRRPNVKTAYFHELGHPPKDIQHCYAIAIQCDSDSESTRDEVIYTMGEILSGLSKTGCAFMVESLPATGYNNYSRNGVKPFYKRQDKQS